jgi:hypothetical protein
MHQLTRLLSLARTRNGLLVIVGALLLLNGSRLINGKYAEIQQAVASKQALLGQYRMSTKDIEALRIRSKQLEASKAQFESHLFSAATERDATSAMQIRLQDVMAKVGMNPESVSAVSKGGKDSGNPYGAVSIKVRLGGNLESFVKLLAQLYKMDTLFRVENFTVKPFKKEELKIFLELKGYYRLTEPPPDKDTPKKEPSKRELQKKGDSGHKGGEEP